jgi:hypothetical protein
VISLSRQVVAKPFSQTRHRSSWHQDLVGINLSRSGINDDTARFDRGQVARALRKPKRLVMRLSALITSAADRSSVKSKCIAISPASVSLIGSCRTGSVFDAQGLQTSRSSETAIKRRPPAVSGSSTGLHWDSTHPRTCLCARRTHERCDVT